MRGKAMTKEKRDELNLVNQDVLLSYKMPFYKWKLYELFILGSRLDRSLLSMYFRQEIESDYKMPKKLSLAEIGRLKQLALKGMADDDCWNADEYINFLDDHFKKIKMRKVIDELNLKTTEETLSYIYDLLRKINIMEEDDLSFLCDLIWVFLSCGSDYQVMTEEEKERFMILEHFISARTREAIGYWTGRMPFVKTNTENVYSRTNDKEKRKVILKEWMADKKMTVKERHRKAMKEWDVSERTILNYEQQIRESEKRKKNKPMICDKEPDDEIKWRAEKTALLRKKDDIA